VLLRPESAHAADSTNEQRLEWFGALGVGAAVVLPVHERVVAIVAGRFCGRDFSAAVAGARGGGGR